MTKFNRRNNYNRNNNRNSKPRQSKKKTKLEDHEFIIGSNKQAAEYEETIEHVINYTKMSYKNGNDVAETLRKESVIDASIWDPTMGYSAKEDENKIKMENRQFEIKYRVELDEVIKRKTVCQDNPIQSMRPTIGKTQQSST